ncbi:hypothetical protein EST38_g14601 [Candolleomyces aberdarensis]|uniref:DUF6533 domain-containing protein n=1 Tax=Candolleomyces aberdarensis TaxID=2316362 RepID=A0A4Q2CZ96_9AGAR|nr:hypothetical protein EST38_g14601 [Candolleomyces aberdarensis]
MAYSTADLIDIHKMYVLNCLMRALLNATCFAMFSDILINNHLVSSQILDYLDTFGAEVTYIWAEPWKLGKLLFLLSRYFTLTGIPFFIYCEIGLL